MVFTDPPWNIPIAGHVSGLGAIKHGDFAMGCGEMSAAEFEAFLRTALGHAATFSDDGAIHFVCMHWATIRELLGSTADLYSDTKNLCVWSKTNAGMGPRGRFPYQSLGRLARKDGPNACASEGGLGPKAPAKSSPTLTPFGNEDRRITDLGRAASTGSKKNPNPSEQTSSVGILARRSGRSQPLRRGRRTLAAHGSFPCKCAGGPCGRPYHRGEGHENAI
jgi:hypothetical protein